MNRLIIGCLGLLAVQRADAAATLDRLTIHDATLTRGAVLLVPTDALRAGSAGAFTGVAADRSVTGNPAGLGRITGPDAFATYQSMGEAYGATHGGAAIPLGPGTVGVAASYLSLGEIDVRDEFGMRSGGETFSDVAAFAGWGMKNPGWVPFPGWTGVSVEFANEGVGGTSLAANLGVLVPLSKRLVAGAAVEHVGSGAASFSLPASGRIGVAWRVLDLLEGAGDLRYGFSDAQLDLAFGLEAFGQGPVRLRAGYRIASPATGATGLAGVSAGAGLRWRSLRLDYAFRPYGDLMTGHLVTIGWGRNR